MNLGRSASNPREATLDPPCVVDANTLEIDRWREDKRRAEKCTGNFAARVAQERRMVLVEKRIVPREAKPIPVPLRKYAPHQSLMGSMHDSRPTPVPYQWSIGFGPNEEMD